MEFTEAESIGSPNPDLRLITLQARAWTRWSSRRPSPLGHLTLTCA